MALEPETSTQIMRYKEYLELLSCVVCHKESSQNMLLLRCGHAVCLLLCHKTLEVTENGKLHCVCSECQLKSRPDDTTEMKVYMKAVTWLRQQLIFEWSDGDLRIMCNRCGMLYWKSQAEDFKDIVEVCDDCQPPQILCVNTCTMTHVQDMEGHEPSAFEPDQHEWIARYIYFLPTGNEGGATGDERGNAGDKGGDTDNEGVAIGEDAIVESILYAIHPKGAPTIVRVAGLDRPEKTTSQLIDNICATLTLFHKEEVLRRETIRQLEQMSIGGEQVCVKMAITKEKIKLNALIRTAAHQMILKALIYMHKEKLGFWQQIQERLSLRRMRDWCFSSSSIQVDLNGETSIVPAYKQDWVHHRFQKNLRELVSKESHIPNPDGSENMVEIGLLERKQSGGWSEISRKDFPYENTTSHGIRVPDSNKSLQIAENLYAVSRPREITLIRVGEGGAWFRQQLSPAQAGYEFGQGLWWNGSSLFATVVGTNYILRWTFQTNSFIVNMRKIPAVRISSTETHCKLKAFTSDNTIAEVNGKLCICYQNTTPDMKTYLDSYLCVCELIDSDFYFVLKSMTELKQNIFAQPRLVGVWGELFSIVLLDVQAQTPTVYFLAGDRGSQESSFKMEFNFKKAAAVKDIWMQSDGDLCLSVELNSGRAENVKIKLH